MMTAANLISIDKLISSRADRFRAMGPSTERRVSMGLYKLDHRDGPACISWVHRAMTRAVGVESSHLRVVPSTEEISLRWISLEARKDPKVKIEVARAYNTEAPVSRRAYTIRYLTAETSDGSWSSY
jgi:hypothetical protein